jgi:peptidoglycan hydrolase-like protein with peptidoglycan-binding domain
MNHVEARAVILEAFEYQLPDVIPVRGVLQAFQAVCSAETQYGQGWKLGGIGSNNWGAVQGGKPPCNLVTGFQYTDTHPNDDGTSTSYSICFKRYASPVLGAADVCRIMYGTPAQHKPALARAISGDMYGVSAAMRAQGYYEGFGRTQADRIANHHKWLMRHVTAIAQALGESMPAGEEAPPMTIKRGSVGEPVKEWQRILNYDLPSLDPLVCDGAFGKMTEARTKHWQLQHGLKVDGIVGPATWSKTNG